MRENRAALAPLVFVTMTMLLGLYFAFASIQGDYGLFRRLQVEAEAESLVVARDMLRREVAVLTNRTHRISDEYLDLDLLDEQSRSVLGLVRADEVVIP